MDKPLTLESLPEVLVAQDIADFLRISRGSVYDLFKIPPEKGGIPNIKIGLSKRVEKADFIKWVAARKAQKVV